MSGTAARTRRRERPAARVGDASAAIEAWMHAQGWAAADFQRECWAAWRTHQAVLLTAPTGSGKTLAAFGGPILDALQDPTHAAAGLRVLWITPLRALAADTVAQLRAPLAALAPGLDVALRSGDSSASDRARLQRKPPYALVTTPESLAQMLSHPLPRHGLDGVEAVIVDEWHELLGSKRGVLLELCLAHLATARAGLKRLAISATLPNREEALQVLAPEAHGCIVSAPEGPAVRVDTLRPANMERFPWAGHLGLRQLGGVLQALSEVSSALLFTNTRAQAELWHQALSAVWPHAPETLALHHGSLDRELRESVEAAMRAGRLRCLVATSTLDLGVDFGPVELVVQIGSPKGIARLRQRAGRAGHRPGATPRVLMVATHALELIEIAAARRALIARRIEPRPPLRGCLDVLAQHLTTLCVAAPRRADDLYAEIRGTHAYAELGTADFDKVLGLIQHGGECLERYAEYRRVVASDGWLQVPDRGMQRRHRWAIGTITADASMQVRYAKGASLGSIEESFLARLKPGERFLFAGRSLELLRIRELTAYVRRASGPARQVPQWMGGRMPLSTQLADEMLAVLADDTAPEAEIDWLRGLLEIQTRRSSLPRAGVLLIESHRSRQGAFLCLFPFAGRKVHEGLAAMLAWRLARREANSFSYAVNDYGIGLQARRPLNLAELDWREWLSPAALEADLAASLNLSELAKRQFRDIAQIAGMTPSGPPGQQRSLRQLQMSSGLLFEVLAEHDPAHILLECARREVLAAQLDAAGLRECLQRLAGWQICHTQPAQLTPFAFPLWAENIRGQLSHEDWHAKVAAMAARLESRV